MQKYVTPAIDQLFRSIGCKPSESYMCDYTHHQLLINFRYSNGITDDMLHPPYFGDYELVFVIGQDLYDFERQTFDDHHHHEIISTKDLPLFIANRAFSDEHEDFRKAINNLIDAHRNEQEILQEQEIPAGAIALPSAEVFSAWEVYQHHLPRPRRFMPVVV
jgi:hypothetical protein